MYAPTKENPECYPGISLLSHLMVHSMTRPSWASQKPNSFAFSKHFEIPVWKMFHFLNSKNLFFLRPRSLWPSSSRLQWKCIHRIHGQGQETENKRLWNGHVWKEGEWNWATAHTRSLVRSTKGHCCSLGRDATDQSTELAEQPASQTTTSDEVCWIRGNVCLAFSLGL